MAVARDAFCLAFEFKQDVRDRRVVTPARLAQQDILLVEGGHVHLCLRIPPHPNPLRPEGDAAALGLLPNVGATDFLKAPASQCIQLLIHDLAHRRRVTALQVDRCAMTKRNQKAEEWVK